MRNTILREVILPLCTRAGTALTAYLVGSGIASDLAEQATMGVIALALIATDLIGSHLFRKKVAADANS